MKNVSLLVITDGRADCLERTLWSAASNLLGPQINHRIIIDDSCDPIYRTWLLTHFPTYDVYSFDHKLGFGGAITAGWEVLAEVSDDEFVWHLEDDFTFAERVELARMIHVLEAVPHLAQLVLKRQPWNPIEIAAGGIVEQHPNEYTDIFIDGDVYSAHNRYFSTNPCLYRRSLIKLGWPQEAQSEGMFGFKLRALGYHCGFWGSRFDSPKVTHIGNVRNGTGY
jgi:hypothetical protein